MGCEVALASPRFHSFVNLAARRWRASVPDQDWGQSLIVLRKWMRGHNQSQIGLLNHGSVDPAAYDVKATDPNARESEFVAIGASFLEGLPQRQRSQFLFLRPWRHLRETEPVADLGGMLIFRANDLKMPSGVEPVVVVASWKDALREDELLPIDIPTPEHSSEGVNSSSDPH
jgi:hypothetical protein